MLRGWIVLAGLLHVLEGAAGRLVYRLAGRTYRVVTVESRLVLTSEETQAWDTDMDIEERVATFRRGLLRHQFEQEGQ